mgnify:FL=1
MRIALICFCCAWVFMVGGLAHAAQVPTAPPANYALAFDGVDDYVEIPHQAAVDFGRLDDSFTVEAWVFLPDRAARFIIAAKGQYGWGDEQPFLLAIDAQRGASFGVGDAAAQQGITVSSEEAIEAGRWHHVAGVRDARTRTLRLYLDGVLKQEQPDTMTVGFTRETPVYIGRRLGGDYGRGVIDELRLSNIARYTADFAVSPAPFVSDEHTAQLWHFDAGMGDIAFDSAAAAEGRIYGARWVDGYPFPEPPTDDRQPPAFANLAPTGLLPPLVGPLKVSIDTDEVARCWFARNAETPLSRMVRFDTDFAAHHEGLVYDLHDGNAYTLYVRCIDRGGNLTRDPGLIRFALDLPPDTTPVTFLNVAANADTVGLYNKFEVSFQISKTYPNPYIPYSPEYGPYGVSVDGLFSPDGWATTITQPGFYYEAFARVSDADWVSSLYPTGETAWKVRFAPTALGQWQYRIRVTDRSGVYTYPAEGALTFNVAPSENPGFIHVSARDPRYFEFSNGETFFPFGYGAGYGTFEFLERELAQIGAGGANFFRWWLSGMNIAGSWTPWGITDRPMDGYLSPIHLTTEAAWGDGLFSVKLDPSPDGIQCMYQTVPVKPNTPYEISARVKLIEVGDPLDASYPYGFMFREAAWAEPHRCLNPGEGAPLSAQPVAVSGTHDWMVVSERFDSGDRAALSIKLNLQNVRSGVVYIDSVSLREVRADGTLGPEVFERPRFNYHEYFAQRPSWFLDYALERAEAQGLYYKFVILEKNDWLYRHIDLNGRPQPEAGAGYFHAEPGAPVRRLHEYYLRYLTARWGYSTSVHSWEAVNENAPGDPVHMAFVNDLAAYTQAIDPNQHMFTTSFWCCGIGDIYDLWNDLRFPLIDYGDIHAYAGNGGEVNHSDWLPFSPETFFDTASWLQAHTDSVREQRYRFPIVVGEMGLTDQENELDSLALDTQGIWLHNLAWAWLYDGRLSVLYWYGDNIRQHELFDVFRPVRAFLDGIPLSSGFYQDAQASVSNPNLRAWGQKDVVHNGLHLWVQNTAHTWKNVIDSVHIAPESGTITVGGFAPGQTLSVETWDTYTGQITAVTPLTTDAGGALTLRVTDLQTDLAFRVRPQFPSG